MSIDWKARCAEHCGTIGKRDATIEKLEAQLEAVRAYVEKHAGDGIDGDHVTWFRAAIGEVSDA